MPSKTVAIKTFLSNVTHKDLADLYNYSMEVQVNVAQDGGSRVDGEYQGRKWMGWSDGITTWKAFRIPFKANTDPYYDDSIIKFDLAAHAEAIGMTGWDWENRCSKWVAFDFDAIIGHESGLSNQELQDVRDAAFKVPWITIRKSTSGSGLHLYVFIDDHPTSNHNEHAALARSILGVMSAITGYDFHSKVDICGGNMWVWHRKMKGTEGLEIVKDGIPIPNDMIPPNWRDHIKVVTGSRRKNLPQKIEKVGRDDVFEELTGQRQYVDLDEEHKALIDFLTEKDALWWWDQDHHMLVTHTYWLKQAHEALNMRGIYDTLSVGTNLNEQNCFCFPMRRGAWTVRRFTPGVSEHPSWTQDGAGWTRCYLNRIPDYKTACRAFGGLEDTKGRFQFREAEVAVNALESIGVQSNINRKLLYRKATVYQQRDGRIVVSVQRESQDSADEMPGWLAEKDKEWTRIFNASSTSNSAAAEPEIGNYDDVVRHLVTMSGEDSGWMIKSDGEWRLEPLNHVKAALGSLGFSSKEITGVVGSSVMKCWKLVNKPFQGEYPGNREWNRNAAQLRYVPLQTMDNLNYPHWQKILNHCGRGLNEAILENGWAKANGILTGADYLKCWVASVFQYPTEPLPYLFFYSQEQDTGKSIFHESLSMLITKGYQRADIALSESTDFNGELEGAIICVVEETDLAHNKKALNRIKDWVTSKQLNIRHMYRTPYHVTNTTHWVQCSNDHKACPIFPGDTRITMCHVSPLEPFEMIPKKRLMMQLEKEAQSFITAIMNLDLPEPVDRLNIPVIHTEDKKLVEQMNQTPLQQFVQEKCVYVEGHQIKFSELYDRFIEWVPLEERRFWTKQRVGKDFPPQFPKARQRKDGQFYIGNIVWRGQDDEIKPLVKLTVRDGYLEPTHD